MDIEVIKKSLVSNSKLIKSLNESVEYERIGECSICKSSDVEISEVLYRDMCPTCHKALKEGLEQERKEGRVYSDLTIEQSRELLKKYAYEHYFNNLEKMFVNEITTVDNIATDSCVIGGVVGVVKDGYKQFIKVLAQDKNKITYITLK